MYVIQLAWKPFRIFMPDFERSIRALSGKIYCGNTATDKSLQLIFSDEPSHTIKDRIQEHWDGLTSKGEETKSERCSRRASAESQARTALIGQSWDHMIPAERKMVLKMELSDEDLDSLLAKYPQ